ncbi:hypothetical protein KDA11_04050, partial [Candidatus Saccharibacteria bacterium]|nr:hypothetical protein [Candidatus Saccharibacteria bacterium]
LEHFSMYGANLYLPYKYITKLESFNDKLCITYVGGHELKLDNINQFEQKRFINEWCKYRMSL